MAGYTRQDTANNIANGNVIDADDFDAEYNAVEAAFNASTGHKHDGTAGEGAPIEKVGPSQDLVVSATDVLPKTTNTLDLGSTGVQFKNGYFDGTLNTDILTVDESATVGTTLGVTGAATLSSTLDVTGNTTVGGTLGVTGATGVDGDFDVNTDKFTVASASGNTAIAGTLAVTGASTLTGNVTASGTLDTGAVTIQSATTPLRIYDTADPANLVFDVATTGNTTVAGTLAVTGGSTFTGAITASGGVTGALSGNATTATTLANARNFSLTGDVTATAVSFDGSGNVQLTTAMANNSVDLGTHTTGNYMVNVTGGTGVTVGHTQGEGSTATISIGQNVATNSDVTFNNMTVSGNLTVSGTTTTVNTETISLADNVITLNSNATGVPTQNGGIEVERGDLANKSLVWNETDDKWTVGSDTFVAGKFEGPLTGNVTGALTGNADTATKIAATKNFSITGDVVAPTVAFDGSGHVVLNATIQPNSVALGTDTTGNYMSGVTAGSGISVTHTAGEGSTATVAHSDTSTQTSVNNSGNTFIQDVTLDGFGHVTGLTSGTVTVGDATITISAGSGLSTGGNFTTNAGTDKTITLAHADTSTLDGTYGQTGNTNGIVTQNLTVTTDGFGHVTGLTSSNINLDDRYYTETEADTRYAYKAGASAQNFSANTLNATTVDLGNWTITESGGVLYFATLGSNKMKLDASGNLTVTGNVTAYGTV